MTHRNDTIEITAHELASLRADIAALRAEVAALRDAGQRFAPSDDDPIHATEPADMTATSRRGLFALAGGAAAAAAVAASAIGGRPAAANNGDPILVANNTTSNSANVTSTFLNYTIPSTNTQSRNLFVVGDGSDAFSPAADKTAAVSGYASKTVGIGVTGYSTVSGGKGVYGHSVSGVGVQAESDQTWSLLVGGTGRVYLASAVNAGPPTGSSYSTGELARDAGANYWVCTAGGVNPVWKRLAFVDDIPGATALLPQLHIIEPTRVYDSRFSTRIGDGQNRVVGVANGIDLGTGAVSALDVVPPGATAIQYTFTIDQAQNNGFLAVTPGDSTTFRASTINWSASTPNIATGALCKLDGARQIKVYAGGGGSTHFIVDITGYYA